MKRLLRYRDSLVLRLMAAFMLVAVPPVLLASEVATAVATQAFNGAVEAWLREATDYVATTMKETEEDLDGAFILLRERFSLREIVFSAEELAAMNKLDIESILVRDESGAVIYTSGPARAIDTAPLYPTGNVRWQTTRAGERSLAFVLEKTVPDKGFGARTVMFAETIDLDPFEGENGAPPLMLRIFILKDGDFTQAYSTSQEIFHIPDRVKNMLRKGAEDYFIPDNDWADNCGDTHLFFKPVRGNSGDIVALLISGATMTGLDRFIADSSLLFWGLFMGGVLLSGFIGCVLARRIVKPIKMLDRGIQQIASGKLGYEVPVAGNDEIAGLAKGFNMMSRQLASMQRDKEQFAKRERARLLGEIALGFAHEIRNPLLVIKASAEMVYSKSGNNSNDTKLLGYVVEEVERINSLLSEFLGFAKPAVPSMERESLSELVDMAVALCRAEFEQRGVTVLIAKETEDAVITCDAKQIQQVLLNLMLNAMDAMPDGGTLRLRICASDNDHVCLEVTDTGKGIEEPLLSEIHLPFVSTKEKGLGLGLAKVYAIIEEHGGAITCSSKAGQGATFALHMKK